MKEKKKHIYSDLKKLDATRDDEIDYSDAPATDEQFWKDAKIVYPQNKKSLTIRIDSDVLEWFRAQGKGYQTMINAVLKSYVNSQFSKDEQKSAD